MRILAASLLLAAACGSAPKKESAIVNEGSDTAPTCCCKTIPQTAEKEIVPEYKMAGRMECSTANGECVDDVQCNGQQAPAEASSGAGSTGTSSGGTGVPPPPSLPEDNNQ